MVTVSSFLRRDCSGTDRQTDTHTYTHTSVYKHAEKKRREDHGGRNRKMKITREGRTEGGGGGGSTGGIDKHWQIIKLELIFVVCKLESMTSL